MWYAHQAHSSMWTMDYINCILYNQFLPRAFLFPIQIERHLLVLHQFYYNSCELGVGGCSNWGFSWFQSHIWLTAPPQIQHWCCGSFKNCQFKLEDVHIFLFLSLSFLFKFPCFAVWPVFFFNLCNFLFHLFHFTFQFIFFQPTTSRTSS